MRNPVWLAAFLSTLLCAMGAQAQTAELIFASPVNLGEDGGAPVTDCDTLVEVTTHNSAPQVTIDEEGRTGIRILSLAGPDLGDATNCQIRRVLVPFATDRDDGRKMIRVDM